MPPRAPSRSRLTGACRMLQPYGSGLRQDVVYSLVTCTGSSTVCCRRPHPVQNSKGRACIRTQLGGQGVRDRATARTQTQHAAANHILLEIRRVKPASMPNMRARESTVERPCKRKRNTDATCILNSRAQLFNEES